MPALTITKTYDDGQIFTESMLDAIKDSIETWANTTKLDSDNLQTGGVAYSRLNLTGSVVNADISTSAAIARSKLAGLIVQSKSANYTLASSDDVILADASGGSITLTLPAAASNSGKVYRIKKTAGDVDETVTVDGNSSETIDGATTYVLYTVGEELEILCDGSNWVVLSHRTLGDWASITLTPASGAFGTISDNSAVARRVGDSLEIMGSFICGTVAGSDAKIALPTGYVVDTNKLNTTKRSMIGALHRLDDSTASLFTASGNTGVCFITNTDTANFYLAIGADGSGNIGAVAGNSGFSNTDTLIYRVTIPISGWKA